jgi:hypothetical protein
MGGRALDSPTEVSEVTLESGAQDRVAREIHPVIAIANLSNAERAS